MAIRHHEEGQGRDTNGMAEGGKGRGPFPRLHPSGSGKAEADPLNLPLTESSTNLSESSRKGLAQNLRTAQAVFIQYGLVNADGQPFPVSPDNLAEYIEVQTDRMRKGTIQFSSLNWYLHSMRKLHVENGWDWDNVRKAPVVTVAFEAAKALASQAATVRDQNKAEKASLKALALSTKVQKRSRAIKAGATPLATPLVTPLATPRASPPLPSALLHTPMDFDNPFKLSKPEQGVAAHPRVPTEHLPPMAEMMAYSGQRHPLESNVHAGPPAPPRYIGGSRQGSPSESRKRSFSHLSHESMGSDPRQNSHARHSEPYGIRGRGDHVFLGLPSGITQPPVRPHEHRPPVAMDVDRGSRPADIRILPNHGNIVDPIQIDRRMIIAKHSDSRTGGSVPDPTAAPILATKIRSTDMNDASIAPSSKPGFTDLQIEEIVAEARQSLDFWARHRRPSSEHRPHHHHHHHHAESHHASFPVDHHPHTHGPGHIAHHQQYLAMYENQTSEGHHGGGERHHHHHGGGRGRGGRGGRGCRGGKGPSWHYYQPPPPQEAS
ncbi:hypothetical protein HKX48_001351, partial [Thoreauomyces humboldtii]